MILLQWAISVMKFLPVESGPLLILRGCVRLTGQDSLAFRDINYTHYKFQITRLFSLIPPLYQNNMGLLGCRKMKVMMMMMMMRGKRKTTCNEGRGKEVGDTEEDEVVEGAETTDDEAGDEMLDGTSAETGADLTSEMKRRGRGITSKVDTVGREARTICHRKGRKRRGGFRVVETMGCCLMSFSVVSTPI